MINVFIYLNSEQLAEKIARELVIEKLVANASIDIDNNYFELIEGEIDKRVHVVVTVQTKSLLFNQLIDFVEKKYGNEIPIYASPLISANNFFDKFIRENTKKV